MTPVSIRGTARMLLGLGLMTAVGCGGQKAQTRTIAADQTPIAITLTEQGFQPEEVTVTAGQPVKLVVTRVTERTCATEFVVKELGIKRTLPLNRPVEVAFTPRKRGALRYACAMDMVSGQLVVQ